MITYIRGDIFKTDARIIVHGCNSEGVMGSGVALQVKQRFPKTFKRYKEYCDENKQLNRSILGHIVPFVEGDLTIINAITQGAYGYDQQKYVSYDAVDLCMKQIAKDLLFNGKLVPPAIAMPKIGAGLGGGNWQVIEAIINANLSKHDVLVYEI